MRSVIILTISLSCNFTFAKPVLIDWKSNKGIDRLSESKYKIDFFHLANQFESQPNGVVCGPTTGAIVLNTLRLGKKELLPKTSIDKEDMKFIPPKWDPTFRRYTPNNFFEGAKKTKTRSQVFGKPINGKGDPGYQLRQLHNALKEHGLKSELRIVDEKLKLDDIRNEITANLSKANDYVVVNYARKSLQQSGGGHISPLGAYHKKTDSVLIMDVNPNRAGWVWVKMKDLVSAMATHDTVENRGYLLVSDKK